MISKSVTQHEYISAAESDAVYDDVAYAAPAPVAQLENRVASMSRPSSKVIDASNPEKPKVALRNFFPESWLFELITVKEEELKRCNLISFKILIIFLLFAIIVS